MDERGAGGAAAVADRPAGHPILLYDGGCGLCAASVRAVLGRDRRGTLRFASLDGRVGAEVLARHPELAQIDSMVWVEPAAGGLPERALTRSDAALRIAGYLGGVWTLALAARLVPRSLRDAVYNFVARHRHRLVGRPERCLLPPPDARARFLD